LPSLAVIVPAHNEAAILASTLPALLDQEYRGTWQMRLVDDRSVDGTGACARRLAGTRGVLEVVDGGPLPDGWAGKVWAMHQAVQAVDPPPDWLLFTDADILHPAGSLEALLNAAVERDVDLFSLMVRLRCRSDAERLLVPAFVYFFAKLYPFSWAGHPRRTTAAAAGGCLLIRREMLERVGGFEAMRGASIDDCALAALVKAAGGRVWLGLGENVLSLRPYETVADVGGMVSRNAYTQLRHSPLLLAGTVLGMALIYVGPLAVLASGLVLRRRTTALAGAAATSLMLASYRPILTFYRLRMWRVATLPLAALFYTWFTIDSARRWYGARRADGRIGEL
jgi:hopene-associated glycosyltransferase HpnB